MTTTQQLIVELKKMPPNATIMLGQMVIGGDPIDVELDEDGTVWLT